MVSEEEHAEVYPRQGVVAIEAVGVIVVVADNGAEVVEGLEVGVWFLRHHK